MDFGEKQDPAGGEIFLETIRSRPPQAENFGVFLRQKRQKAMNTLLDFGKIVRNNEIPRKNF